MPCTSPQNRANSRERTREPHENRLRLCMHPAIRRCTSCLPPQKFSCKSLAKFCQSSPKKKTFSCNRQSPDWRGCGSSRWVSDFQPLKVKGLGSEQDGHPQDRLTPSKPPQTTAIWRIVMQNLDKDIRFLEDTISVVARMLGWAHGFSVRVLFVFVHGGRFFAIVVIGRRVPLEFLGALSRRIRRAVGRRRCGVGS